MLISFLCFLSLFVLVGLSSFFFSRGSRSDYYLASQSVPAWLVGLSAVATNNSGYMFIGVIGFTYMAGLDAIWLMIGWILGDFIASTFIHRRLHLAAITTREDSYAGLLGNWTGQGHRVFQRLAGLISIVFLSAYASAQFVAGGKALQVVLNWPAWGGVVVSAILVMFYCFAGGIRASIWTDAAQSFVMLFAMGLLSVTAIDALGGIGATVQELQQIPGYLSLFPEDETLALPGVTGGVLFAASWLFAGFSVIGQPHIMVRFMTLRTTGKMFHARLWYYGWYILFYGLATTVGLLSRVYIGEVGAFDAELALPLMALELLPAVLVGLVLAGMFAATMSTADSLVLSCSASITHDLLPRRVEKSWILKTSTIAVTLFALGWALLNRQSVFNLVVMAWSTLASAFAPVLIVLALGGRPSQKTLLGMMVCGMLVALGWRWLDLHEAVYEGMPGILAGLAVYLIATVLPVAATSRETTDPG